MQIRIVTILLVEDRPVERGSPCLPSPCGPNSQCQIVNNSPSCSCLPEYLGLPPNCRPECISNSECPIHQACTNRRCTDPCIGSCGSNTECRVVSHTPMCVCRAGFTGDPFTQCIIEQRKKNFLLLSINNHEIWILKIIISTAVVIENRTPCTPSPCGSNAVCREQNGAGSCTCLPEYIGNPYEGCRPECTVNSDCLSNLACIQSKCQNPCLGTCGPNADCQVINHSPSCNCISGYTGDPFRYCSPARIPGNFNKFI